MRESRWECGRTWRMWPDGRERCGVPVAGTPEAAGPGAGVGLVRQVQAGAMLLRELTLCDPTSPRVTRRCSASCQAKQHPRLPLADSAQRTRHRAVHHSSIGYRSRTRTSVFCKPRGSAGAPVSRIVLADLAAWCLLFALRLASWPLPPQFAPRVVLLMRGKRIGMYVEHTNTLQGDHPLHNRSPESAPGFCWCAR